jgi:hypothetical protein
MSNGQKTATDAAVKGGARFALSAHRNSLRRSEIAVMQGGAFANFKVWRRIWQRNGEQTEVKGGRDLQEVERGRRLSRYSSLSSVWRDRIMS